MQTPLQSERMGLTSLRAFRFPRVGESRIFIVSRSGPTHTHAALPGSGIWGSSTWVYYQSTVEINYVSCRNFEREGDYLLPEDVLPTLDHSQSLREETVFRLWAQC